MKFGLAKMVEGQEWWVDATSRCGGCGKTGEVLLLNVEMIVRKIEVARSALEMECLVRRW